MGAARPLLKNPFVLPVTGADDVSLLVNTLSGRVVEVPMPVSRTWGQDTGARDQSTVDYLKAEGFLHGPQFRAQVAKVHDLYARLRSGPWYPRTVALVVTSECNLACTYCFQRSAAHSRPPALPMSTALVNGVFEAVRTWQSESGHEPRCLALYGGEPLLPKNRVTVETILDGVSRLRMKLWVITNGTSLIQWADELARYPVEMIDVSVDGTAAWHDRQRPFADGTPTFDAIADGVDACLGVGLPVRVTMRVDSFGMVPELAAFADVARERGWAEAPSARFHIGTTCRCGTAIPAQLWDAINSELAHLDGPTALQGIECDFPGKGPLLQMLSGRPTPPLFWHCGANGKMLIVDVSGEVYSCWAMVGEAANRLGVIDNGMRWCQSSADRWRDRNAMTLGRCGQCRYAFLCGGGCAYLAWRRSGTVTAPHCPPFEPLVPKWLPYVARRTRSV